MTRNPHLRSRTQGSTLIEVLVAILILSFGLLAIGSFLAYTVQLPKLSGNRSVAVVAGNDLIERMRSNPTASGSYVTTTYATATFSTGAAPPTSLPSGSTCSFP
nr:type IV pilus modification protein PilV [Burkholderiaceae bacterium]